MTQNVLKIGEKSYQIPSPIPVGILRHIEPDFIRFRDLKLIPDEAERSEQTYAIAFRIIGTLLKKLFPEFKDEDLENAPISGAELVGMVRTVGVATYLFKEPKPGEAQAAPQAPLPDQPNP